MPISWFDFLGMVGITIVIVAGTIFDPLRDFLESFTHKYNPLPWVGKLISCSMCSGVWVGFIGGVILGKSLWESAMIAGVVSVAAVVIENCIGMIELAKYRMTECGRPKSPIEQLVAAKMQIMEDRARQKNIAAMPQSEEEAHEVANSLDEHADSVLGHIGGA